MKYIVLIILVISVSVALFKYKQKIDSQKKEEDLIKKILEPFVQLRKDQAAERKVLTDSEGPRKTVSPEMNVLLDKQRSERDSLTLEAEIEYFITVRIPSKGEISWQPVSKFRKGEIISLKNKNQL